MKTQEEYALEIDEIVRRDVESCQNDWFRIDREIFMQPENRNKIFILGTRKTGCDLIILGGTNCDEGSMDWLGTNHELSKSGDSIKRKHVHELKRIFQILLDHQGLKVLGTVNVIVDEVCGEGTWIKYSERSERWRKGEEERERIKLERLRKEEEARYKDFDEKLEEWKSGEINFLNTPLYIPGEKPNAWIRIKGNIIETSKQIKIGIAEARKLWRAVSAMHRGAEFRHGLVEDIAGHQWSLNRYENDLLTA